MRGKRGSSTAVSGLETVLKREVTQEELVKRDASWSASLEPRAEHAFSAVVLLVRMYHYRDSVAFAQLLGVPRPLVWMVPLLARALFWVILEKVFLAVGQELIMLAATAMPLLLVDQELMFANAAAMTLVLRELPLFVVPLLLLLGCVVVVRWRRQEVVWISVMLIPSLRAFSLACHQLTVIVLCLTSLTVVARCMRV